MNLLRVAVAVAAISILVALLVWYPQPQRDEGEAKIIISLNFGQEVLKERTVKAGQSALEALKEVANVSTSYGGGFVSGIDGINSDPSEKKDWFYYINGFLANVGAKDYVLRDGDVMRWDYHAWGDTGMLTAELADFPAMFTRGYGGEVRKTIVAYDPQHGAEARRMADYLQARGVHVSLIPADEVGEEKKVENIIVVGQNSTLFSEINSMQVDMPFRMVNGRIVDWKGNTYEGAYAEAIQSPFNPKGNWACENIVLVIAGDDLNGCIETLLSGKAGFWVLVGDGQ